MLYLKKYYEVTCARVSFNKETPAQVLSESFLEHYTRSKNIFEYKTFDFVVVETNELPEFFVRSYKTRFPSSFALIEIFLSLVKKM